MIRTVDELYAAPEFQSSNYEEQQQLKQLFFQNVLSKTPEVSTSNVEEQQALYEMFMRKAPAFEGLGGISLSPEDRTILNAGQKLSGPNAEYKQAIWLKERAEKGDANAVNSVTSWVALRRAANETLLGQIAMGAKDAIEEAFGWDQNDEIARDKANLAKMSSYMISGLTQTQAKNVQAMSTLTGVGAGFTETVALNVLLGGPTGLLTKGLFQGLRKTAEVTKLAKLPMAATGAVYEAMRGPVPLAVEAVGSGLIDTMRSIPELVNDSSIKGDGETWNKAVQTFGEGAMWDLVFAGGVSVMRNVLKPFGAALRKVDITNEKSVAELLKASDSLDPKKTAQMMNVLFDAPESKELLDQLEPEVRAKLVQGAQKLRSIRSLGDVKWNTKEGFETYATLGLHDVEFGDNGVIKLFRDGQEVFSSSSMPSAASYISNYMRNLTPETLADEMIQGAMRAASPDTTWRRVVTAKAKNVPITDNMILTSLTPNANGALDGESVKFAAKHYLRNAGIPDPKVKIEVVSHDDFFNPANVARAKSDVLYVPDQIRSANEDKIFLGSLRQKLGSIATTQGGDASKVSVNLQNLQNLRNNQGTLSPWTLQVAAEKLGGKVTIAGQSITLTTPGNAPQTFTSLIDANRAIAREAMAKGLYDDSTVSDYLKKTGRELTKEQSPGTNVDLYVVRRKDGTIEKSSDTLEGLVAQDDAYLPKLPEVLAPNVTFVDDSKGGLIKASYTYASGPESAMRQMLDNYTSYGKIWKQDLPIVVDTLPDGSTIGIKGRTRMEVQIPSIGFRREFSNLESAKKFMKEDSKRFDTLEQIANEKGYRIDPMPTGNLSVRSSNGDMFVVKSKKELYDRLKAAPDPEWAQDLVKVFGKEADPEVTAKLKEQLKTDPSVAKYDFVKEDFVRSEKGATGTYLGSFLRPMRSTLERLSKLTGDYSIGETARQVDIARRMLSKEGLKAETVLNNIFKINGKAIDRESASVLGKFLEVPETSWEAMAKSLEFNLTPEHVKVLHNTRALYDYYATRFGVDIHAMITDYAPKIRDFMLTIRNNPKARAQYATMSKAQIINELFAGRADALKTVDFFAKHTRLDTFLSVADNKNIVAATRFYVEHGLREQYLAPVIEKARTWMAKLAENKNVNETDLRIIKSYFESLTGEGRSATQEVIGNRSLAASTYLSNMLTKVADKIPVKNFSNAIKDIADNMITLDMPSKLESMVTYSTLGARPIRALTNLMQYNNTIAVFGSYADEAIGTLNVKSKAMEDYVKKMFKKGLLTERIFASGAENPKVMENLLERSLRSQQNVEYFTRAWTARAAEIAFDTNYGLLAAGKIDLDRFVKLANMDFLSPDSLARVKDHLVNGRVEAARDLFQADSVRTLMFDYAKENYPLSFKGVMGRMFGKFGVYPMGQLDLYNRILTSGNMSARIARGTRMMTTSLATYEAFRMAGIDYSGFLFYDPIQFSGGPLYQATQDVLNSRDTGPAGALARRNLSREWQLLVPFSLQAKSIAKALESGSNGELQRALIESMSAKYTPDSILTGATY